MEFVMNKIIDIDKDAEAYRQGIEKLLKEKELELEKNINSLKNDWIIEEKRISESIITEKLTTANEKARTISKQKEEQLKIIRDTYTKNSDKIINDIFLKIINSF